MSFLGLKSNKDKVQEAIANPIIGWSFFVAFLFWLLEVLLPTVRLWPSVDRLGAFIPLHYNVFFGIDSFGPWYNIFFLPATGLFFAIINFLFIVFFTNHDKFLSAFCAVMTVVTEIVFLAAVIFIILLNL